MSIPTDLMYTHDHTWMQHPDRGICAVGVTHHIMQEVVGDVVYVELPKVGSKVKAGDQVGSVEGVKSISDVYAPVSGEVVKANPELDEMPELLNDEPYDAWLFMIRPADGGANELLSAAQYKKLLG